MIENLLYIFFIFRADEDEQREITYEIIVEGSYSFLHDATCKQKHGIRSIYRGMTIKHFWDTLNK